MEVIVEPNQLLHQVTKPVTLFDESLKKNAEKMRETMHTHHGMGLAAPQVNLDLALTVIEYLPKEKDGLVIDFLAICNPQITWESKQTEIMTEGCLSVPGFEGQVSRPKRVKVKAQDLNGEKIVIKASGLLARILQHEIDHLNGILYTEKLVPGTELKELTPGT